MKLGTVRKIDQNGRVQIPSYMREALQITPDTSLNVVMDEGKIVISLISSNVETNCAICGVKMIVPAHPEHAIVCTRCAERWSKKK